MELYEQIRREYEHGSGTIRAVSRKLGVHRREVRKALASAIPAQRKVPDREHPKLGPAIPFIDLILEADRKAPRKQRHTAHRIWTRLRREMAEVRGVLVVSECEQRVPLTMSRAVYVCKLQQLLQKTPPHGSYPADMGYNDLSFALNPRLLGTLPTAQFKAEQENGDLMRPGRPPSMPEVCNGAGTSATLPRLQSITRELQF